MIMETEFKIALAGRIIGIRCQYGQTLRLCRDYLSEGEPDFTVSVSQDDIENERQKDGSSRSSRDAYLETLAVYRKISEKLLEYGVFLMHGAAVADGGSAYLFIARSGTGKTTHARLWLRNAPDCFMVNGDKPLILTGDPPLVCGTPWSGKERMNTNTRVPLKAIVELVRSEENRIARLSFTEALPMLLQQTYRPAEADAMRKTLTLLTSLNGKVGFYRFEFNNFKPDAFEVAYRALHG